MRLAAVVLGGVAFGGLDAMLVMHGGAMLVVGNLVSLWLSLGVIAGAMALGRRAAAGYGLVVQVVAVLVFYAVKGTAEGVPGRVALLYLLAAVVVGPVCGVTGWRGWALGSRLGLLGLVWVAEPCAWMLLATIRGQPVPVWSWRSGELPIFATEFVVGVVLIMMAVRDHHAHGDRAKR